MFCGVTRQGQRARERHARADAALQVVVYSEQGRSVGLVVDRILDIVEEAISRKQLAARDGVLGSAVIQGRVTEFLDVRGSFARPTPTSSKRHIAAGSMSHGGRTSILHVLTWTATSSALDVQGAGDHPLPGDDRACRSSPPVIRGLINLRGQIVTAHRPARAAWNAPTGPRTSCR